MQYVLKKDIKKYIETQFEKMGDMDGVENMIFFGIYSYSGIYEVGATYDIIETPKISFDFYTYSLKKEGSDTLLRVLDYIFKKCFKSILYERNKKLKKLLV